MKEWKQVLAAAANLETVGCVEEFLLETAAADLARVSDGEAALATAKRRRFDLVLAEFPLPRLDLTHFLKQLRHSSSRSREAPVVVVTGSLDGTRIENLGPDRCRGVEICTSHRQALSEVARCLGVTDRVTTRIRVGVTATTESWSGKQVLTTRNLSSTGMLLSAEHLLPVGSVTPISIELAPEEPLVLGRAEVVRHADVERESLTGMGMRFLELHSGGGDRIAAFVDERLGLVH